MHTSRAMKKDCRSINPLPQFSGTCWFNAILMCLYHSMCGRFVFMQRALDVSPDVVRQELMRMFQYQQIDVDGRPSRVFKPEHLIRQLRRVDRNMFDIREDGRKAAATANATSVYTRGADVTLALRNYLEYTYRRNFAILQCRSRSVDGPFSLVNHPFPFNDHCRHPLTGAAVRPTQYWCRHIRTERPECLCIVRDANDRRIVSRSLGTFDPSSPTCIVDGVEYVQDSCIIHNHNLLELKRAHVVAGVTCKLDRYIYNGWAAQSTDPALAGRRMANHIPCPLYPMDWIKSGEDFCISTRECRYPNVIGPNDMCFNPKKGIVVHFLYRRDVYESALADAIREASRPPGRASKPATKKDDGCPPGSEINPATGRCRKACADDQVRNPATGRCVKKAAKAKPVPPVVVRKTPLKGTKPCPPGKERNPATNRCRKIRS